MALATTFKRDSNQLYLDRPLTDGEIFSVAPSIFAAEEHESRSRKYRFISTFRILQALRNEGFEPFMVVQSNPRDQGKHGYAKHMLRLRFQGIENGVGGFPEIIFIGSHDGTTSLQLLAGWFEFVCTNGMVCGQEFGEIRVPHMGHNVIRLATEGAHKIVKQLKLVDNHRSHMKEITLTKDEQGVFAQEALGIRYGDDPCPIEPWQVLISLHPSQSDPTLWNVFNRIQEHLVTRGGLQGRSGLGRRMRTRPIRAIDTNISVNRKLWTAAEKRLQLAA